MATDLSVDELPRASGIGGRSAPCGESQSDVATGAAKAGARERNGGIDALRAAVTLLVVFHHAAITYGAPGSWYYREVAPSETPSGLFLTVFVGLNQAWFMGLFFLLAGYYTSAAYDRRGAGRFVRERLMRLGVPLVVYVLLLHTVTFALVQKAKGYSFVVVFAYLWTHARFHPGPLWFAEALLIFSAAWLLWRTLRKAAPATNSPAFPSNADLLAAAVATGLAAFLLRLVWPVGVEVAYMQLGYFASYIVLFAAGCAAAGGRWLEQIPEDRKKFWLRLAWIAVLAFALVRPLAPYLAPLLVGRFQGGWNLKAFVYSVWEPFVAWGFILGLLSLFQRRFVLLGDAWTNLARRAFLIYIIHPLIVVGVALAWRGVAAPALAKFIITGSIACALCYLAAGVLLRVPVIARIA